MILIFLLTIFLPSITLSIFGIIALRNERFKFEKEFREEQTEIVQHFKTELNQKITDLENELQYMVLTPSFINKAHDEIFQLVENQLKSNPLSDQVFVLFEGEEPLFPPVRITESSDNSGQINVFKNQHKKIISEAEYYEFTRKNYRKAITLLEGVRKDIIDNNLQGQLMNIIARNQMKLSDFNAAAKTYNTILSDYPESLSSSGIPLFSTVRLQLVDCFINSGLFEEALKITIAAFEEIICNFNNLSEDRFTSYSLMIIEKFNSLRGINQKIDSLYPEYADEFEKLNSVYQTFTKKWQVINILKNEFIPVLSRELIHNYKNGNRFRYSEKIGTDDFLILSMIIPGETITKPNGLAGIKLNNTYLQDTLIRGILKSTLSDNKMNLLLSDPAGQIIEGDSAFYNKSSNISSYFDNNFPPWRIEVPGEMTRSFMFTGFYKSFYFWSILTMIMILIFGIVIIGRTIAYEKEILQLKSDFVSSVSHEFKTPITSIKALTERLLEGSVKDPKRVSEYYSVISRDAEDLSRLVENILDFSKTDEGKKEYLLEETDFKEWIEHTIIDFSARNKKGKTTFRTNITDPAVTVKIDKASMKLAIDNLLDNAVKFSSENPEVSVLLEKQEKALIVRIKDSGIGIPKDEHTKIFEKFYRGKGSAAHSATGTGLGLTIVKQVIEAHKGQIQVESEVGKGSIFTISIPLDG